MWLKNRYVLGWWDLGSYSIKVMVGDCRRILIKKIFWEISQLITAVKVYQLEISGAKGEVVVDSKFIASSI